MTERRVTPDNGVPGRTLSGSIVTNRATWKATNGETDNTLDAHPGTHRFRPNGEHRHGTRQSSCHRKRAGLPSQPSTLPFPASVIASGARTALVVAQLSRSASRIRLVAADLSGRTRQTICAGGHWRFLAAVPARQRDYVPAAPTGENHQAPLIAQATGSTAKSRSVCVWRIQPRSTALT